MYDSLHSRLFDEFPPGIRAMDIRLLYGLTIHPSGDVFRPQDEHRLTCIGHFVAFVAFVMRQFHHLLGVIVLNGVLRNLVVSIDRDMLALAVLDVTGDPWSISLCSSRISGRDSFQKGLSFPGG